MTMIIYIIACTCLSFQSSFTTIVSLSLLLAQRFCVVVGRPTKMNADVDSGGVSFKACISKWNVYFTEGDT